MLLYLECATYALGLGIFLYLASGNALAGVAAGLLTFGLSLLILRPWKLDLERVAAHVDGRVPEAGYSSALLLSDAGALTGLSRLQRFRVAGAIREPVRRLVPPNGLLRGTVIMVVLLLLGIWIQQTGVFRLGAAGSGPARDPDRIEFAPMDSLVSVAEVPILAAQLIRLDYPAYTGKPDQKTEDPNIRALSGTSVYWDLQFEGPVAGVVMERGGEQIPLRFSEGSYSTRQVMDESGFYSFRYTDTLGNGYISDLYSLEAVPDKAPTVIIDGVPQFTYFEPEDRQTLKFTSQISDDYGIGDAYIVATVSKGTGESVKFREERLPFDTPPDPGVPSAVLSKRIDLRELQMEAGDELYFYVEALDRKQPRPNRGRSETYFAVIRDTTSSAFAVEGTMGVDLMPDYFRSQRQLIIDTEKLIGEAPVLADRDFKFRSNELGFDQKALRIKYGQFMGEETEMGLATEESAPGETGEAGDMDQQGHDHEGEDETDPLSAYTHDHDGDNEHNLVMEEEEGEQEDPLHEYLHNHEDPEAATLFEESLRTKLRKALDVMWDAELQLRLYKPEASLPYQYEALQLLQEIKNSARIYVHRIGFDPPPIREEKRLTGDLKGVGTSSNSSNRSYSGSFPAMRQTAARLQELIEQESAYTDQDRELFDRAGQELAAMAVEEPGRYLTLLRNLKATQTPSGRSLPSLSELRQNMLRILPEEEKVPGLRMGARDSINTLFLRELMAYE